MPDEESPKSFARFAETCAALAATRSRLKKRAIVAEYLAALDDADAALATHYLIGQPFAECDARNLGVGGSLVSAALLEATGASSADLTRSYRTHGDLGDAAELLYTERKIHPQPSLTLAEVAEAFSRLATNGKRAFRLSILTGLLKRATAQEARYLIKITLGDMRTGTKQSIIEEAIAEATSAPLEDIRRAVLYTGDLGRVTVAARRGQLANLQMSLFHPLGFMLASPVDTVEEAIERLLPEMPAESAADAPPVQRTLFVEDKFDGMRAQIHCGQPDRPGHVVIYSRNREDITASFPEIARAFQSFPVPCILDGEVLGWDRAQQRALPFATFSNRLGRKVVSDELLRSTPVAFMAFDILLLEKDLLLDTPLHSRRQKLERAIALQAQSASEQGEPAAESAPANALFAFAPVETPLEAAHVLLSRVARPASAAELDAEFARARDRGNEGLMVKDPESLYTPGRRGLAWLKIKRELATLDVVITGAEFGSGRRAGTLSDYTFAVQDAAGLLRNVGKAYSGLTDAEIAELSQWCIAHTHQDLGHFRTVDPEIVLEVAFNNVMRSTRHDSGFALRFPRILRIRQDKPVSEIDTMDRVEEVYQSQPDKPNE